MQQKEISLQKRISKKLTNIPSIKLKKLNHIYSYSNSNLSNLSNIKYFNVRNKKIFSKNIGNLYQDCKYQLPLTRRLSDFNSFMKKIGKQNNQLPSVFQLIHLKKTPITKNIENINQQHSFQHPNFKILSHSIEHLIQISTQIIQKFGLAEIDGRGALIKLIREISIGYNTVAYHNFSHGFSLSHMFYHVVKMDSKFKALFSEEEVGFVLVGGLAHDIDHRGTNNIYEIKMKSELSKLANSESILEKMHIRKFFNMIRSKNITLLAHTKNSKRMKQLIIRVILATDISKHFKGINKIKLFKSNQVNHAKNQQDRYNILQQVFHACDIGNPCLEFDNYIDWAILLSYQFNNQTKLERANNVEVSEMLRYRGKVDFFKGQVWFINVIVFPIWNELGGIFKGIEIFVKQISKNVQSINVIVKELQAQQNFNG